MRSVLILFCIILLVHDISNRKLHEDYVNLIGHKDCKLPFIHLISNNDSTQMKLPVLFHFIISANDSSWKMKIDFSDKWKIESGTDQHFEMMIKSNHKTAKMALGHELNGDMDIRLAFMEDGVTVYKDREVKQFDNQLKMNVQDFPLKQIEKITITAPSGLKLFHVSEIPTDLKTTNEMYRYIIFGPGDRLDLSVFLNKKVKLDLFGAGNNGSDISLHISFETEGYKMVKLNSYTNKKWGEEQRIITSDFYNSKIMDLTVCNTEQKLIIFFNGIRVMDYNHRGPNDDYHLMRITQNSGYKPFRVSINKFDLI